MSKNNRSPEMQKCIDDLSQKWFKRTEKDNVCVTCGSDKIKPKDFKDDLSRKEFKISTMCQKCQDSVFDDELYDDEPAF